MYFEGGNLEENKREMRLSNPEKYIKLRIYPYISSYSKAITSQYLTFSIRSSNRYANSRDAAARHSSDARQRPPLVLLRIFHIRHRRRPALGGNPASTLLPQGSSQRQVSRVSQSKVQSLA